MPIFGWGRKKKESAPAKTAPAPSRPQTPAGMANSSLAEHLKLGGGMDPNLGQTMHNRVAHLTRAGSRALNLDLNDPVGAAPAPAAVPPTTATTTTPPRAGRLNLDLDDPVGAPEAEEAEEPTATTTTTTAAPEPLPTTTTTAAPEQLPTTTTTTTAAPEPLPTTTTTAAPEQLPTTTTTTTTTTATTTGAPQEEAEPAGPAERKPKFRKFKKAHSRMASSQKGGLGRNSDLFRGVEQSSANVTAMMQQPLSGDVQQDREAFNAMISAYSRLLTDCDAYTSARSPHTSRGKARKETVQEVKRQAQQDVSHLKEVFDQMGALPPGERPQSMAGALDMARTRTITLRQGREADLKHVGGAVSYLGVINPGDATDPNASGFFKETVEFDPNRSRVERFIESAQALGRRKPEYRAVAEEAVRLAQESNREVDVYSDDRSRFKGTREALNFDSMRAPFSSADIEMESQFHNTLHVGLAAKLPKQLKTQYVLNRVAEFQNLPPLELGDAPPEYLSGQMLAQLPSNTLQEILGPLPSPPEDLKVYPQANGSVRVSDRNVAMSRMAGMLGIGDLVAQTERAKLQDAEGGGVKKGTLMQKARGQEVSAFFADRFREEAILNVDKPGAVAWGAAKTKTPSAEEALTPEFLQSLTSLQVLDSIVGQADRHHQNYFAEVTPEGKLGRVQGIDNDFAFGFHTLGESTSEKRLGKFGHKLVDAEGNVQIPYMDKALADRILSLREPEIRLMMEDVLEDWAIDSLCGRVAEAQQAIRADQKTNPGRYLKETSQWDRGVMDALADNGQRSPPSYVGELLKAGQSALPRLSDKPLDELRDKLEKEQKQRIWAQFAAAEDKREFLSSKGVVKDGVLNYAQEHAREFSGTAEEMEAPDVKWMLDAVPVDMKEFEQGVIAEQERIRRARAQRGGV